MLTLTSVPGSGTHFFLDYLFRGWNRGGPRRPPAMDERKYYWAQHCYPKATQTILEMGRKYQMVIPLRHPMSVLQTTKNRGQDITLMIDCFKVITDCLDVELEPCYLPLDIPERQDYLDKLNERCGTEFVTDFPVIRPHIATRRDLLILEHEHDAVLKMMEHPFYKRFGYE